MTARRTSTAVVALHGDDRAQPGSRREPAALNPKIVEIMGDDQIIPPRPAAKIIGYANSTLQLWRSQGTGPKPVVINGKVRGYTLRALKEFIRQHEKA